MSRIKFLSKLKEQTAKKEDTVHFFYALIALGILSLFMIIMGSYYIYGYSQEPTSVTGQLRGVTWTSRGIYVYVDGDRYKVFKNPYSNDSFGIIDNLKLGELKTALEGKTGKLVYLEYLKTGFKNADKEIVQLTVDGVDYVEKSVAISDYIGYEKIGRRIFIVIFVIVIACCILIKKGIIT